MGNPENPATALAQLLRSRETPAWARPRFAWALAAALWLLSLPASAVLSPSSAPEHLIQSFAWTSIVVGALGGLSLLAVAGRPERESALLVSFQKGGCLDEILGTCLRPRDIVDGLAISTVRRVASMLLPFVAFASLSVAVLAKVSSSFQAVWTAWAVALLLLALLVVSGSYLFLANGALTLGREERSLTTLRGFIMLVAVGIPMPACMVSPAFGGQYFTLVAALSGLWVTLLSRQAALWSLSRGGGLRASVRWLDLSHLLRPSRPNRWIRPWSENPIVAREAAREAHRVPLGLVGALLARGGLGLLAGLGLAAWILSYDALREEGTWVGVEILLAVLSMVFLSGGLSRAVDLVISEHESKTLPQLLASPLTLPELASGVVSVAIRPILVQYLAMVAPLLVAALFSQGGAHPLLVAEACLPVLAGITGAWLGLQAAAPVPTRQQALARGGNLSGLWLGSLCAMLLLSALALVGEIFPEAISFRVLFTASCGVVGWAALRTASDFARANLEHRPAEGVIGFPPESE